MNKLQSCLYTNQQIREIERIAIEDCKIPEYTLMQRAGEAAFEMLQKQWPQTEKMAVCCGGGNNGGDGYVVAYLAHKAAIQTTVYSLVDPKTLKGAALQAYQDCLKAGVTIQPWRDDINLEEVDLIVDALLGTGIKGEVRNDYRRAIDQINCANKPVLAIDTPSGLNVDTGCVMGAAVKAKVTMAFIGMKQGLFTAQGPEYCGEIFCNDLSVSAKAFTQVECGAHRLVLEEFKDYLKPRARDAHKGDFGHVLIIGGDYGMAGAARMAGEAAARIGAGLVSVATRPEHAPIVSSARPELMCHGIENSPEQSKPLENLFRKASVIAIGPGLGQSPWSQALLELALATQLPLVIDADALNLLVNKPQIRDNWILTPHPGEAARLLGCTAKSIQHGRFHAIRELREKYSGNIILKGSGTLVLGASNQIALCDAGNPGMATGGMGDLLTGIIAGLIAQKIPLEIAAKLGVLIHASAADRAAKHGERGMLAMDLMPHIRSIVNSVS